MKDVHNRDNRIMHHLMYPLHLFLPQAEAALLQEVDATQSTASAKEETLQSGFRSKANNLALRPKLRLQ